MRVVFGQWAPDQPGVAGNLIEASNVLPLAAGYGPMPSVVDLSNAATENLLTCFVGRWASETILFAASANFLWRYWASKSVTITGATQANPCVITSAGHGFRTGIQVTISGVVGMTQLNGNTYTITRIDANTFSLDGVNSTGYGAYVSGGSAVTYKYLQDVTRTASAYSATTQWQFAQFGVKVIASNGQNVLQSWTIGSSSNFADIAAAAPTASYVATVRDFVVGCKSASNPNRVFWSDINDETDWVAGVASQSDTQDIPDGGEIRGITGGEYGVILLERSIVRMTYIGAPLFFQFDNVTTSLGCYEGRSIVRYGGATYFLSDDGFYVTDGQSVKPIGAERVDRWFFDNCDPDKLDEISTAVDPVNKNVMWCFTTIFNTKQLLVYNWAVNRWSHGETSADAVATIATSGTDLEALSAIYPTLESVPASLDSRIWVGGKLLMGGVDGMKLVSFGGTRLTGTLQTGDLGDGVDTLAILARPIVDGGSATVSVSSRRRLDDNISYSSSVAADSDNRVAMRSRGKYHRISVVPTGQLWATAVGIDVDLVPCGGR